jgi:hypothetical protein
MGFIARRWRRRSASAELLLEPRSGARCAIRDTGAAGADRYHWTVTAVEEPHPVAVGRTNDIAVARSAGRGGLGRLLRG